MYPDQTKQVNTGAAGYGAAQQYAQTEQPSPNGRMSNIQQILLQGIQIVMSCHSSIDHINAMLRGPEDKALLSDKNLGPQGVVSTLEQCMNLMNSLKERLAELEKSI